MTSRRSLQVPAGLIRPAALVFACLLLSLAQSPALGSAQGALKDDRAITKETLIKALEAGVDPERRLPAAEYIGRMRERGVKFLVTPADERKIRNAGKYLGVAELNKLISALRDNYRPATSMSGRIEQVKVVPNPGGGIQVFVQLTVRNYGPPSVARKFNLRIMHATSASIDFNSAPVTLDPLFLGAEGGSPGDVVIRQEDALTLKTVQAISTDASVTGWLRFYLPPIPQTKPEAQLKPEFLRQPGIWYVMSFTDVAGEIYEGVFKVN